jgi:acetyl-CoA/propionyl-CoA carboxylase biotin carboxyl carrier protein
VDGWRLGAERDGTYAWSRHRLRKPGGAESDVLLRGPLHAARTRVDDGEAVPVSASLDAARGLLRLSVADVPSTWIVAFGPGVTWVGRDGRGWPLHTVSAWQRAGRGGAAASAGGVRLAPMPGTVTVVKVAAGDTVTAGQTLLVVEAMKMEHVITAPFAGVVSDLHVRSGQVVAMDEPLVAVEPADQHPADPNPADQDPAGQDTVRQDTASQDAASRDAGDEHPDGRGKEGR